MWQTSVKCCRNETSPLVYHKTLNYGDCILEKRAAAAAGINEKVFVNTKGQISEGTVSNIFFVRKNMIYTPQLSCGLLPGNSAGIRNVKIQRGGDNHLSG